MQHLERTLTILPEKHVSQITSEVSTASFVCGSNSASKTERMCLKHSRTFPTKSSISKRTQNCH